MVCDPPSQRLLRAFKSLFMHVYGILRPFGLYTGAFRMMLKTLIALTPGWRSTLSDFKQR